MPDIDGALTFARFAYPPNELGYCGPDAGDELLQRVVAGVGGVELRALAEAFQGAWPYLELIATANHIADPLDPRVVEAYWIGNSLLDHVDAGVLAVSLVERFHPVTYLAADRLLEPLASGAVPHHSFHVFGVYPWVGLLRGGRVEEPLHVLDRCRVRWGQVQSVDGDEIVVQSRPLEWDGRRLLLGEPRAERVIGGRDGRRLGVAAPGDWCALHWDWLCQSLQPKQLAALQLYTHRQLDAINATPFPAPAAVLA